MGISIPSNVSYLLSLQILAYSLSIKPVYRERCSLYLPGLGGITYVGALKHIHQIRYQKQNKVSAINNNMNTSSPGFSGFIPTHAIS